MNGKYEEKLDSIGNGTFRITKASWEISYYFPGPDLRYNGTFLVIKNNEIDDYIRAYIENWEKYLELKQSAPKGGALTMSGLQGMSINCGGYWDGVCITGHHMPINNYSVLFELLDSFRYCKEKAPQIIGWLSEN